MDKENFMDTKEKKNNKKNPKRYSLTLQILNLFFRGYWFELHKPQSH
jgi:hypothetical protein